MMTETELLKSGALIVDEVITGLPLCNCLPGFKAREMPDPRCVRCAAIDQADYNALMQWRVKVARYLALGEE
jgi:hypothetical protein